MSKCLFDNQQKLREKLKEGYELIHGVSTKKFIVYCFCHNDEKRQQTQRDIGGRSWYWEGGNIFTSNAGDPRNMLIYRRNKLVVQGGLQEKSIDTLRIEEFRIQELIFRCHSQPDTLYNCYGSCVQPQGKDTDSALSGNHPPISSNSSRIADRLLGSTNGTFITVGILRTTRSDAQDPDQLKKI